MKFSEQWLREWVPQAPPTAELIQQLTMAGLEVDAVEPVAPRFAGVVVAEVKAVEPHPDSDHLHVCQVDPGEGPALQIVCGAANVRAGLKTPLARIGAELPGGLQISAAKLRGISSSGMLCSAIELGLADNRDGLLELAEDAPVGTELWSYYQLDDQSLELNITANRGDCLSLAGVAREVALLNAVPVTAPVIIPIPAQIEATFPVTVAAAAACPVYAGRVIKGVNARAQTPLWMLERLRRSGIRGISPVVDVTNYVMLELGQPMHAFDLQTLQGGIEVRYTKPQEKITLLDGQELVLHETTLVIADAGGPLALAGIMGGLGSGVTESTQDVFLESAYFAQPELAGQARRYNLQTDSSYRFERGVDFELQTLAIERATELLLAIVGGSPGPVKVIRDSLQLPKRIPIRMTRDKLRRLLGCEVNPDDVSAILQRLGFTTDTDEQGWTATPPSFRFDLELDADLVEEVVRVYGYDTIPADAPHGSLAYVSLPESRSPRARLRDVLVDRGYQEAITYSFVDPELQQLIEPMLGAKPLLNPIAADMGVMRTSLWPGLLKALAYNLNRQSSRVRLFESGLIFTDTHDGLSQTPMLGGAVTGGAESEQWGMASREVDFFDLKADIEALLSFSGAAGQYAFVAADHPALHPGQSAKLLRNGKEVGLLGRIHPRLQDKLGIDQAVFVFQILLTTLEARPVPKFSPLSKFPQVRRDISVTVDKTMSADAILSCAQAAGGSALVRLQLFDVYEGTGLEPGKKSLALGLTFQGTSSTLTDSDVEALVQAILSKLKQEVGAILRS